MALIDIDEVRAWSVAGGELAKQFFNHTSARRKADRSLVTEADEAIERLLVERISARYPDHGIIGEEHTRYNLDREYVWAIDPLDGTASFVSGLPTWGVSIGLLRNQQPYAGVIYLPLLDDCYHAVVGEEAYLNEHSIHVSAPTEWDSETWLSTPATMHRQFELDFIGKTRVLGSTAASMCYVARGSAVGALLVQFKLWDIAAGMAIVQSAGGTTRTLHGHAVDLAAMLANTWEETPLLVADPAQLAHLQQAITPRTPPSA